MLETILLILHFNPRSHKGSDASAASFIPFACDISIHAPTKGATGNTKYFYVTEQFQSTLPQRERHVTIYKLSEADFISIHAPTKGATALATALNSVGIISIHAPTKGATRSRKSILTLRVFQSTLPQRERLTLRVKELRRIKFQSTLPQRERRLQYCRTVFRFFISIHAPTKGATSEMGEKFFPVVFQSTLPQRERHVQKIIEEDKKYFNPRSHKGSDMDSGRNN